MAEICWNSGQSLFATGFACAVRRNWSLRTRDCDVAPRVGVRHRRFDLIPSDDEVGRMQVRRVNPVQRDRVVAGEMNQASPEALSLIRLDSAAQSAKP